ncbi:hypothetical protein VNO77_03685 [Canavalia gladiata]|uniref:Uncharacterized protein n=1 Tax=Canavalia gladiata TaxID=3824 RepID=A0AAN9MV44_CANGL
MNLYLKLLEGQQIRWLEGLNGCMIIGRPSGTYQLREVLNVWPGVTSRMDERIRLQATWFLCLTLNSRQCSWIHELHASCQRILFHLPSLTFAPIKLLRTSPTEPAWSVLGTCLALSWLLHELLDVHQELHGSLLGLHQEYEHMLTKALMRIKINALVFASKSESFDSSSNYPCSSSLHASQTLRPEINDQVGRFIPCHRLHGFGHVGLIYSPYSLSLGTSRLESPQSPPRRRLMHGAACLWSCEIRAAPHGPLATTN